MVKILADIFRNATNDRIFMAPYIRAKITIFLDVSMRYRRCALRFLPSGSIPEIMYMEYPVFIISATNNNSYYVLGKEGKGRKKARLNVFPGVFIGFFSPYLPYWW